MGQPLARRPGADRPARRRRPGRGRRRSGRTGRARRRGAGRPSAASRRPALRTGSAAPAAAQGRAQARVERARPQAGLVHDPEAVGEARVLGGREDPARALELADPAQALEPGGVEEVLLGDVLVRAVRRPPTRPAARRLVSSTYPWIGSLIRLTAANGCRAVTGSRHPDAELGRPRADVAGSIARPDAQAVPVPARPVRWPNEPCSWCRCGPSTQPPRSVRYWTSKSRRPAVCVWSSGIGATPGPADVVARDRGPRRPCARAPVRSFDSVRTIDP